MTTDRIPRVGDQITSAEDLDALPVGSVVVDRMHDAALHLFVGQWQYAESQLVQQTYAARYAPFTVLYVPGEQPRPSVTDDARADVPLSHAADMIRSARAYAATGDRAGVRRLIEHARIFLAQTVTEVDR